MWNCDGTNVQKWILRDHVGGYVSFENFEHRGQCLDVDPDGLTNQVRLWDCNFGASQRWLRE